MQRSIILVLDALETITLSQVVLDRLEQIAREPLTPDGQAEAWLLGGLLERALPQIEFNAMAEKEEYHLIRN